MAGVRLPARLQVCSALPGKAKLATITEKPAFARDGLLCSPRVACVACVAWVACLA